MSRRSLVITTGIVAATALATVAAVASPPGQADRTHATEHMGELDARAWEEMHTLMDGDATMGEMHQWMAEQDLAPAHMRHAPDAAVDHDAMHGRGTDSMHEHGTRDGSHA